MNEMPYEKMLDEKDEIIRRLSHESGFAAVKELRAEIDRLTCERDHVSALLDQTEAGKQIASYKTAYGLINQRLLDMTDERDRLRAALEEQK